MVYNVAGDLPCTTNFLEGTHNAYVTTLTTRNHPTIASFCKVLCDDVKMVDKDVELIRRNPSLFKTSRKEQLKADAIKNMTSEYKSEMSAINFLDWLDAVGQEAGRTSQNLTKERERARKGVSNVVLHLKTSSNLELRSDLAIGVKDQAQQANLKCPRCFDVLEGVKKLKAHLQFCRSGSNTTENVKASVSYICPGCRCQLSTLTLLKKHLTCCDSFHKVNN